MPDRAAARPRASPFESGYERLVRELIDDAVMLLDREGRIVSCNQAAERLTGHAADELFGKPFSLLYAREAVERLLPEQELKAAEEAGRYEDEGWRLRKDGTAFWAYILIAPVRDDAGALRGYSTLTRDLTERRRRDEALRATDERLRLLAEGVKDAALIVLDAEGRVGAWNAGAQRLTGYLAEEILGRPLATLYPRDAVEKKWPEQELAMAREQGRLEQEGPRLRKDGTRFWSQVSITPLYDVHGALAGYGKVIRDLTDRKRVEALEKAERQTSDFLSMVAHELRNPLAPISNALHLLARKPAADGTEQWVRDVLQRQTAQITRLVEDLLEVSRISRAAITLDKKPFDARSVARAVLEGTAREAAPVLTLEVGDEPLYLHADEARFRQILQNLLQHALRHARGAARVPVRVRREGADVVLTVGETAAGSEQPSPADPPVLPDISLTLVERLVQMHEGSFTLHTAGERGGAYEIRLPALTGIQEQLEPRAEPVERAPRRRILVVDDNQDAANALRLLLENDGHEVEVATDGVSGLALARRYKPDYLLLDIGLPRLSGYDIAATLREDPGLKGTVMVAITGYGQLHDRARTAAVGFDHHLTKPVEFAALQALFREARASGC